MRGTELSVRELEVASLVAEGLTDRAVATRFGISVRTVESHVRNILNNLGVSTRAEIAFWVARRGIDDGGPTSGTRPASTFPDADTTTPRQLPADIGDFTGRHREVAGIREVLQSTSRSLTAVVGISGTAGVGKSTLAVHVAHQLYDTCPDGQLYVDLRGVDEDPLDSDRAITFLLQSLGVDPDAIPSEVSQRAALYRSRLRRRRLVIVIDNASDEAQVLPLLPGGGGCPVLITSSSRLAVLPDAHLVDLDVLSQEDAIALLGRMVGDQRVIQDMSALHPRRRGLEYGDQLGRRIEPVLLDARLHR